MTTDRIKALVDLGPDLQKRYDSRSVMNPTGSILLTYEEAPIILAAIEALTPIADGVSVGLWREPCEADKNGKEYLLEIETPSGGHRWRAVGRHWQNANGDEGWLGLEGEVLCQDEDVKLLIPMTDLPTIPPSPSASTGKDGVVERVARAICRENCAFVGEKPCFEVEGAWPNPNCQEPGCHSQARAALAAINGEK